MIRFVYCFSLCLFCYVSALALDVDSVYQVPRNPLLNDLLKKEQYVYPVHIDAYGLLPTVHGQYALRTPNNLYITIVNTGILYKMTACADTVCTFKRIDKTIAIFYNVGAYYFTDGEDVYSFAGYGFWKNNGTLRKYNFKDGEWDVYPVSEEIIPQISPVGATWYDVQHKNMYVPFQRIMNSGIQGSENLPGVVKKGSFVLRLLTGKWEQAGNVSSRMLGLLTSGFPTIAFHFDRGTILVTNEEWYWIDYQNNQLKICRNSPFVQTLNRQTRGFPIIYLHAGKLCMYSPQNKRFETIPLDLTLFEPTGHPVWDTGGSYFYWGLPVIILVAMFLLFWIKRNKAAAVRSVRPPLPGEQKSAIPFEDPEMRLLEVLLEKAKFSLRCSIDEINYYLGLKDKNQGLQKKMRSDIINNINQKYKYLMGVEEPLVRSVRSEQDKRYFEYYVDPEKVALLEKMIRS